MKVKVDTHVDSLRKAAAAAKNEALAMIFGKDNSDGEMLWGLLHIKIVKCVKLRNLDRLSNFTIGALRGKKDKSDPYVEAFIDEYRLLKTSIYQDNLDPVFDEEFFCPVAHYTEGVTFNVMDQDIMKDELMGKYILPVKELIKQVDDADMEENPELAPGDLKRVCLHKIVELSGKKVMKSQGALEFMIEFIPTRMLPKSPEVPGVYFHTTYGNDVKLYMNADDDGSAPIVKYGGINDDEKVWKPPRLWRDIYDCMCNAKQFIYAVGWSFDTDQYLLRGEELTKALADGNYSPQIGELLKSKADEGLVVNLMQWDDYSSSTVTAGKMGTYDEKTRRFFSGTKVKARFMSMIGGETNTFLEGQNKKMAFTHHQKFIIMDAPKVDGSGRELFAFIGGIDLTEGRWDNRQVCFGETFT
jgi:phospholipase D1/2